MRNIKRGLSLFLLVCAVTGVCFGPAAAEEITVPVFPEMKRFEIPDSEGQRLLKDIRCGWNLGNTFDAYDGWSRAVTGTRMESFWVGTVTTRELIAAVHDAGFNALRLPVSWHNHVDRNFRIDGAWLDRVREVADWALDLGMYVVVNVHHDNDPAWFYPDSAHYEQSAAYLTAVWTQLAEAFADRGDHLLLESMNEPRLTGTEWEWSWNPDAPECRDAAECVNRLNQLFVDTVRASGGNNASRWLLVPAYDAAPWYACTDAFRLPRDPAGRIILETHAYSPYPFALDRQSSDVSFDPETDMEKKREISGFLNDLYDRFVSRGVPVLMDEFGALEKRGNTQARVNYTAYYTAAASARGITCFLWDNHSFSGSGERFGLIHRDTIRWEYPEVVKAITVNCLCNRE